MRTPPNSQEKSCRPTLLAQGPIARVEQCHCCEVVTIHLGAISLRLDAEALSAAWLTLGEAVRTLKEAESAPSQPAYPRTGLA